MIFELNMAVIKDVEVNRFRCDNARSWPNNACLPNRAPAFRHGQGPPRKGLLRLTIVDDGKGFDTKKSFRRGLAPKGLGLSSMRERAEEIGGTLRITSRPGQTRVEVRARAEKRSPASNA